MKIEAPAKINLTLYVTGRRPDGYHDLELIFQPVTLVDELWITDNDEYRLNFSCSVSALETGDNLVCRGYRALAERYPGQVRGLDVHLDKHIPSGAGMGGGSTDCAALLVFMDRHFGLGLGAQGLIEIGAGLGADVPACLFRHATLGRGIGEQLSDIRTHAHFPLLVIKPDLSFRTGEMYAKIDGRAAGTKPEDRKTQQMIAALEADDAAAAAACLTNEFETVVPEQGRIQDLLTRLRRAGALGSRMTGSGSAVFGLFDGAQQRDLAFVALRNLPGCRVFRCETLNEWE